MSTALTDRTVGQLVGPDGSLLHLPTTLIGADQAAIIRAAFYWYLSNQLEPELFCSNCFDHTRESKAVYNITEQEIEIVCGCALRVFMGATLPPQPVTKSVTIPQATDTGPALIQLSDDAARLLRLYKRVVLDLGLKQAVRCNACYNLDQADGCEASTTENQILIRCRCSRRVYQGMSL